ncbi:hypothetical protein WICMUC_001827 [Wickerhamomyces mucosus]|uniref:Uncharacterized protein n=1 Tax=Wickerhamomyces mucosus TaxID=1378264 RepID=A0A9P8PS38_9ASCO|nr:hypothetical protein WICMUC_001827 [Wickerhamomyces mucosus]
MKSVSSNGDEFDLAKISVLMIVEVGLAALLVSVEALLYEVVLVEALDDEAVSLSTLVAVLAVDCSVIPVPSSVDEPGAVDALEIIADEDGTSENSEAEDGADDEDGDEADDGADDKADDEADDGADDGADDKVDDET